MYAIRSLNAFKVCPFGEGRMYTKPKVTDVGCYFYKAQMFDSNSYDDDHRQRSSLLFPGFNLIEIVGSSIKVVAVVNRTGSLIEIDGMLENRDSLSRYFFLRVLAPAIDRLPVTTRTRKNNLTTQIMSSKVLPAYFRVYPEDISALSSHIMHVMQGLPHDAPYRLVGICWGSYE